MRRRGRRVRDDPDGRADRGAEHVLRRAAVPDRVPAVGAARCAATARRRSRRRNRSRAAGRAAAVRALHRRSGDCRHALAAAVVEPPGARDRPRSGAARGDALRARRCRALPPGAEAIRARAAAAPARLLRGRAAADRGQDDVRLARRALPGHPLGAAGLDRPPRRQGRRRRGDLDREDRRARHLGERVLQPQRRVDLRRRGRADPRRPALDRGDGRGRRLPSRCATDGGSGTASCSSTGRST